MSFLTSMFKTEKPVIGMLHLRPLPGDPLYYPGGSVSQVVEAAKRDLEALQRGGVDGILITNELSMPYEQHVSPSTLASMGYVIGVLSHDLSTPWGAEAIYDGDATIELCAAVDAQFTRCNFCGAWAGDLGLINRDFAHTMRRKTALRLDDLSFFTSSRARARFISTTARLRTLPIHFSLIAYRMRWSSAVRLPVVVLRASLPMRSASVLAKCLWYVAPVVAKIPWLTYLLTTMARLSAPA